MATFDIDAIINELHTMTEEQVDDRVSMLVDEIRKLADAFRKAATKGNKELAKRVSDKLKDVQQLYRITRGYLDPLFFAYEYFSADKNEDFHFNIITAKGATYENAPAFHRELCLKLAETIKKKIKKRIAWAAPRGSAKTSYLSKIFVVHQLVYRCRNYILLISETVTMAQQFLEFSREALKSNKKLVGDFGELLSESKMQNKEDNKEAFVTVTNTRVTVSSPGTQFRGASYGSSRPDLLILDDIESAENTATPSAREKVLDWFDRVILPAMDIERGSIVFMGTMVHEESLLANVLERSTFDSDIKKAVIEDAENEELWLQLKEIFTNKQTGGEDAANKFHESHKEELERGARVIWPQRFSYYDLMKIKWEIGTVRFNSEYQNIAPAESDRFFDDKEIKVYDRFDLAGRDLETYIAWDPSLGRTDKSDYNAIVTVAVDTKTREMFVVDTFIKKCTAEQAMEKALEIIDEFEPTKFGVESVVFSTLLYTQLKEKLRNAGKGTRMLVEIKTRGNKQDKIKTLQPLFETERLKLHSSQDRLREQLLSFPSKNAHDDGPDALAMAVSLVNEKKKKRAWTRRDF